MVHLVAQTSQHFGRIFSFDAAVSFQYTGVEGVRRAAWQPLVAARRTPYPTFLKRYMQRSNRR
jgi:hypothetical protein